MIRRAGWELLSDLPPLRASTGFLTDFWQLAHLQVLALFLRQFMGLTGFYEADAKAAVEGHAWAGGDLIREFR